MDALRREFGMQRPRQAAQTRLADRERSRREPDGGVESELAAGEQEAAAPGTPHARQHGLDGGHRAADIDREIGHRDLGRQRRGACQHGRGISVADENLRVGGQRRGERSRVGRVGGGKCHALARQRGVPGGIARKPQHREAAGREAPRHRRADARAETNDGADGPAHAVPPL